MPSLTQVHSTQDARIAPVAINPAGGSDEATGGAGAREVVGGRGSGAQGEQQYVVPAQVMCDV
jgi:hypothetical protein